MSQTAMHSSAWHRVSQLRPRLRSHVRIHRHVYRDQVWYVMQDQSNGQYHRYTPEANLIIRLMDGRRTVQEIWEEASDQLADDAMPQDEVIRLMSHLHQADVLQTDRVPDAREMAQRRRKQRMQQIRQYMGNPSALRIPLVDPERFLNGTVSGVRWIFTRWGLALWLLVTGYGLLLGIRHWDEFTRNSWDQIFSLGNLLAIALIYPVVKAIHELGHAYAVKVRGGEVHEIGLMLLFLFPIPYVDASAASAFPEKRWRMLVGGAGILVEVFLAALAMIAWANLDPGPARALAYNVILICGVSTLLMNGNPLLRYDGYYVLADALEIPNLGQRSNAYLGYLFKRYVLMLREAEPQKSTRGERVWFVVYGIASFFYRMFVMFLAIFLVASQFFFVGMALAIWSVYNVFILPLWRLLRHLFTDPHIQAHRRRSWGITTAVVAGLLALAGWVPWPSSTVTEGVVWAPPGARIRAPVDGFVQSVISGDSRVQTDDLLLTLDNADLDSRWQLLDARSLEVQARYHQALADNPVQAQVWAHQWRNLQQERQVLQSQVQGREVHSPYAGRFVRAMLDDPVGSFVQRGQVLGYVLDGTDIVRVVVPQDSLDRIHQSTEGITVRLAQRPDVSIPAQIVYEMPAATDELPSEALSLHAGGSIGASPAQHGEALRALDNLFIMDLALPPDARQLHVGGRVHVKFSHAPVPLARQVYGFLRQKFLRQFGV